MRRARSGGTFVKSMSCYKIRFRFCPSVERAAAGSNKRLFEQEMRHIRRGRQGLLVAIGRTSCTAIFQRVMSCHEDGELVSKKR